MAVEVVGGDVEQHTAFGREGLGVLELEARGLADHRDPGVDLADQRGQRRADVAGDRDRLGGGAPYVGEQLCDRRLAVGPGHGQEGVRQQSPGQLELADDRQATAARERDRRGIGPDPRALDHAARPLDLGCPDHIQEDFDALPLEPCRARGRSGVDADHRGPARGQQPRGSLARPRETDDEVGTVRQRRTRLAHAPITA